MNTVVVFTGLFKGVAMDDFIGPTLTDKSQFVLCTAHSQQFCLMT